MPYQLSFLQLYLLESDLCKFMLFSSNLFISNTKIKQMLSNTLRLNFYYLEIIHILHPHYQPKVLGYIVNSKQNCLFSINYNENGDDNEK